VSVGAAKAVSTAAACAAEAVAEISIVFQCAHLLTLQDEQFAAFSNDAYQMSDGKALSSPAVKENGRQAAT
jgi:hypothetical protein